MRAPADLLVPSMALAVGLICVAIPVLIDRLAPDQPAQRFDSARFSATVDGANAHTVALPHRWSTDCADCSTVWYRFDIPLQQRPREAQSVYLPAVAHNAAVYLNGQLLAQTGPFTDPVARFDDRPFIATAPVQAWQVGDNHLYVLAKADPPQRGWMPALYVGTEETIVPVFRARSALWVTARQAIAAATAMLGVIALILWTGRRGETAYAWLAAASVSWSLHIAANLAVVPLLKGRWWDGLLAVTFALTAASTFVLARRLTGVAPTIGEMAAFLAPTAAVAVASVGHVGFGLDVVHAITLATCVAAAVVLCTGSRRKRPGARWLLAPGAALMLLALHDLAGVAGAWSPAEGGQLLPFAALLVVGVAAWALLARFVETLNAAELLNVDLELMIQEKTRELYSQFEKVRDLEHKQVVAAERERLMRDMHDGVGGNLVSLLAMIESERTSRRQMAAAVRSALDDMRLMIDSLDPVDDDLNAVLAMYRDRLIPRMTGSGIDLAWEVDLLPPVAGLTPARVLHVLRLLQEAVTNSIKHGGARSIRVTAHAESTADPAHVRIAVADDGSGFDPNYATLGRGLANMERRAAEIGAALQIESAPGCGTRISLVLPFLAGPAS
jgi:signal transduction histidine kinase